MASVTCTCGQKLEGAGEQEIFGVARAHVDAAHPELKLRDENIRDFIRAGLRMTGGTERLERIGTPHIRPLTPELHDDYLNFFDHDAFTDNYAWASCYCMFHYFTGADWGAATAEENRAAISERIRAGRAYGYLAYVDGKVAGWCNAAPRPITTNNPKPPAGDNPGDPRVGAVVCFVIAPLYRRHGIARMLLDAACEGFRQQGMRVVEGYPRRSADSDGAAYTGPLSMYLDAGFVPFHETDRAIIVRRALDSAAHA